MSKLFSFLGLGTIIARRNLFNYLKMAEENKHSHLGKHFLDKAVSERNAVTFLKPNELEKIDQRISEVAKLHTSPVQN